MAHRLFSCFGKGSSSSHSKHENSHENGIADLSAEEERRGGPVVVELFSSQGCATSPEAELLFSRLGRDDFNPACDIVGIPCGLLGLYGLERPFWAEPMDR
ncbi:Protein of unknown function (DUF1223) [Abeliophyllum distichum]|uniref:Uncharacterized protein n=1 Tax=Abeliophyllum distichum TaxID=126358 RepID=A0ABD1PSF3_9LAMI